MPVWTTTKSLQLDAMSYHSSILQRQIESSLHKTFCHFQLLRDPGPQRKFGTQHRIVFDFGQSQRP